MILGIESSCDESAVALFCPQKGVIGEWVHSQLALHSKYGGVVPALASREHLKAFSRLLEIVQEKDSMHSIEKIAVTYGPGLAGCLALGIGFAQALALAWQTPLVGVNHLRGHAYSPFISLHEKDHGNFFNSFKDLLPHLGLLISGGNTLLFTIDKDQQITILGQTVDDAAGEALDKGAKLLGMPYPGGALIEQKAKKGDSKKYDFPRAFCHDKGLLFSFSGLKTSLRYRLEKMTDSELEAALPDICASYQAAVVDSLAQKTELALQSRQYASVGLSGGVANNQCLQVRCGTLAQEYKMPLLLAKPEHTGDNAAMIAFAAYADPQHCITAENYDLTFQPAAPLTQGLS